VAQVAEIVAFLDELLDAGGFDDYGPNGLQVPGPDEASVIASGVSAHRELFGRAGETGAQLVLCHHGILWNAQPRAIGPALKGRLETLFSAGMGLAAYHLPLDAHPEVGNNALICEKLGLRRGEPVGTVRGRPIGFVGEAPDGGLAFTELRERCRAVFGRDPFTWDFGPDTVSRIGIVSGGGASLLPELASLGVDAFLTGEPAEHAMADAREAGMHFVAAGHYATETFGVRRLGEIVSERFDLEHVFIDVPNPV
jgi:dinuclear metal center YbgI/SA1388 family protein